MTGVKAWVGRLNSKCTALRAVPWAIEVGGIFSLYRGDVWLYSPLYQAIKAIRFTFLPPFDRLLPLT